jgi:SAM-dependent methyltransferase
VETARRYEALHVPALFREWAPRVLDAAAVGPGDRVVDVACGTGVVAREAAKRVGPTGAVVGIDPDYGMIAVRGITPTGTQLHKPYLCVWSPALVCCAWALCGWLQT